MVANHSRLLQLVSLPPIAPPFFFAMTVTNHLPPFFSFLVFDGSPAKDIPLCGAYWKNNAQAQSEVSAGRMSFSLNPCPTPGL
jgi:hypothetical protein